jgi:hypothetical protein
MILEAFAEFLHSSPELPANQALSMWLWDRLKNPPASAVDQVIHCEVGIGLGSHNKLGQPSMVSRGRKIRLPEDAESSIRSQASGKIETGAEVVYFFEGASLSGVRLLNSLYEYAMSYEQQKWSRFVHKIKASDFKSRD